MKTHVNFYENIKEAQMRINNTIVLYDGEPYYVICVCDHKPDGIFRVYLDPIGQEGGMVCEKDHSLPVNTAPQVTPLGDRMDAWMTANPTTKILRKMMNSPAFNRFRPFPLGMSNFNDNVVYIERQPTRKVEQGLTTSMLMSTVIEVGGGKPAPGAVHFTGVSMRDTILGLYPAAEQCIEALTDPTVSNKAAAFHRNFAFVRGPVNTLYLAYKTEIVGFLPGNNLSVIQLGRKFSHTKEVVAGLGIFNVVKEY